MALPNKYGIDKKMNSMEGLSAYENGGKGSGNFGHEGRPGEVGGSAPSGSGGSVSSGNLRARLKGTDLEGFTDDELLKFYKTRLADEKEAKERAKSIGASKETIDSFDESIEAYEKDIATLEAEKQRQGEQDIDKKIERAKDYGAESHSVAMRDGSSVRAEYADLAAQLSTARTNLKQMQKDKETAYDDLAGRNRYLTRQSEIAKAFLQARALGKSKLSTETKKLVKEMEYELKSIWSDYTDLGTKKYFDPDLNMER